MIRIKEEKTIETYRGDTGAITYKIPTNKQSEPASFYEFKAGDIIRLSIFQKGSNYENPLKEIVTEVTEDTTEVTINISSEDTIIGDASSKPIEYDYEISLNGTNTTTGYDFDNGSRIFRILPAKGVDE